METEIQAAPATDNEAVKLLLATLQEQIAELRALPKNHKPGTAGNKQYIRLGAMNMEGKVPLQQANLAEILTKNMEEGKVYSEAEVFAFVIEGGTEYPSILNSKQDPTYLFRYYRGLKRSGKHAGFVDRGFLKVV